MNTPTVCTVGQLFPDLPTAKNAIAAYVIDNSESYKVRNSNKERYTLVCKDKSCKFTIRATTSKSKGTTIRTMKPHRHIHVRQPLTTTSNIQIAANT
jgi:hypothetical protein